MANSKYIKQPISPRLPQYIDEELRKIERNSSDHAVALDAIELDVSSLGAAPIWTAVTFQNSWVNYGGAYQGAEYTKTPQGQVHIRGTVKNGVIGSAIFTLPAGYRPSKNNSFAQAGSDATGTQNLYLYSEVQTSGVVLFGASGVAANTFGTVNMIFYV